MLAELHDKSLEKELLIKEANGNTNEYEQLSSITREMFLLPWPLYGILTDIASKFGLNYVSYTVECPVTCFPVLIC